MFWDLSKNRNGGAELPVPRISQAELAALETTIGMQ